MRCAVQRAGGTARTGNILLEDVKLLENGAQKLLRVLVHDKNLPFAWRLDGANRFEKFCEASLVYATGSTCFRRTIPDGRDEGGHRCRRENNTVGLAIPARLMLPKPGRTGWRGILLSDVKRLQH